MGVITPGTPIPPGDDQDVLLRAATDTTFIDVGAGPPVTPSDIRYVVTLERRKTILQAVFADRAPFIKRVIAKIVGFDGAYHRFTGRVTIEKFERNLRVETFDDHAIWELMYFGQSLSPKP